MTLYLEKRGRPTKDEGFKLVKMCSLRLLDSEYDLMTMMAAKSGKNVNSYIRNLIMNDYQKYCAEKIKQAEENTFDS